MQRPLPRDLHRSLSSGFAAGQVCAKHAQSAVASHDCPHSVTVLRQLDEVLHGLLPPVPRQKPTPRATDRAVAGGGGEGGGGDSGGKGGGGGAGAGSSR